MDDDDELAAAISYRDATKPPGTALSELPRKDEAAAVAVKSMVEDEDGES
jgi:hypothetical protein